MLTLQNHKVQNHTSASTSINSTKVPAVFRKADFCKGTVNLDLGGGKYDTATEYLKTKGVENLIYDPYNRSDEHNVKVLGRLALRKADTCTLSNVLNVIDTGAGILRALDLAEYSLKKGGICYITVYEGDRSGIGRETKKDCWQNNMKLGDYYEYVYAVFGNAHILGKMIVAVK